jgi:inorganic pyrophosphatase
VTWDARPEEARKNVNERRVIDVVVEIPKGSRNKYEWDRERRILKLDRRLFSATTYPADYGFIPNTLAEDGDALDALVLLDDGTFPGCWITDARPVGVLWMKDEKGEDAKIICVLDSDPARQGYSTLEDFPEHVLSEIQHFFNVYKDLEPHKSSSTQGYAGVEEAWREIESSSERARKWGSETT